MSHPLKSGALLVTCNQVFAEGAVLLRNILLARMLGPEQMGLAVMLRDMLQIGQWLKEKAASARCGNIVNEFRIIPIGYEDHLLAALDQWSI